MGAHCTITVALPAGWRGSGLARSPSAKRIVRWLAGLCLPKPRPGSRRTISFNPTPGFGKSPRRLAAAPKRPHGPKAFRRPRGIVTTIRRHSRSPRSVKAAPPRSSLGRSTALRNRWFARLTAGGRWIRTFSTAARKPAISEASRHDAAPTVEPKPPLGSAQAGRERPVRRRKWPA